MIQLSSLDATLLLERGLNAFKQLLTYTLHISLYFLVLFKSRQDLAFKFVFADFKTAIKQQFIAAHRWAVMVKFKRDIDNVYKTYHWNFEM